MVFPLLRKVQLQIRRLCFSSSFYCHRRIGLVFLEINHKEHSPLKQNKTKNPQNNPPLPKSQLIVCSPCGAVGGQISGVSSYPSNLLRQGLSASVIGQHSSGQSTRVWLTFLPFPVFPQLFPYRCFGIPLFTLSTTRPAPRLHPPSSHLHPACTCLPPTFIPPAPRLHPTCTPSTPACTCLYPTCTPPAPACIHLHPNLHPAYTPPASLLAPCLHLPASRLHLPAPTCTPPAPPSSPRLFPDCTLPHQDLGSKCVYILGQNISF